MLTREEEVDAYALRKRGWSISAIARHLGRDRKTVRRHLNGEREAGTRQRSDDWFAVFAPYITARFDDDKHLWTTVLYRELTELGFSASYARDPGPVPATGVQGVCRSAPGHGDDRDRPSTGRGDAVRLARAERDPVGRARVGARRGAQLLVEVPGFVL